MAIEALLGVSASADRFDPWEPSAGEDLALLSISRVPLSGCGRRTGVLNAVSLTHELEQGALRACAGRLRRMSH
jgi:hypothetical protein